MDSQAYHESEPRQETVSVRTAITEEDRAKRDALIISLIKEKTRPAIIARMTGLTEDSVRIRLVKLGLFPDRGSLTRWLTAEQDKEMLALHRSGTSVAEIAEIVEIDGTEAHRRLIKLGAIRVQSKAEIAAASLIRQNDKTLKMFNDGASLFDIAIEVGLSEETVRNRLIRLGAIEKKTKGGANGGHAKAANPGRPPKADPWTDERLQMLRELWPTGKTGKQMAALLGGGLSRCAVIAKGARIGLPARKANDKGLRAAHTLKVKKIVGNSSEIKKAAKDAGVSVLAMSALQIGAYRPSASQRLHVLNMKEGGCRWPIGDPLEENFTFCGCQTSGGSYCDHHVRIAYQPVHRRRTLAHQTIAAC